MQFVWLFWSLGLVVVWAAIYLMIHDKEGKREMISVSLWTSLLGLTEPLFVPEYWSPPSLFGLAERTGFDIESLIFAGAVGGIAYSLYRVIFRLDFENVPSLVKHKTRHRYHLAAILLAPALFVILFLTTKFNPIYDAIIALTAGGALALYCRPDLWKKMMIGAILFLGIYFVYFTILIATHPGYVQRVWNLEEISGIFIFGVPLEELLFAFSFGLVWSGVYEHVAWKRIKYANR